MSIKNLLWLFFLAGLWGPSFLFIKVAVQEIPPITLAGFRVGIAAAILYALLRAAGRRLPLSKENIRHFLISGAIGVALPFVMFSWGEIYVDSALASILNGTTPLFTIVIAHLFIPAERMTSQKTLGALVGLGGLIMLVGPALLGGLSMTFLGFMALIASACCYGISIVYTKQYMADMPPLVAPTAQLGVAAICLLPLSFAIDGIHQMPLPSWQATGSLLGLAIFGTAIAFAVYYHMVSWLSATEISMVTYLIPVFGIFLGVVVLNEKIAWNDYFGCFLILLGVMIVNGVFSRKKALLPTR